MDWQPIETAPKDGRAILVSSKDPPVQCYIAAWNADGSSWTNRYGGFDGHICKLTDTGNWACEGGWFQPNEVTHWMPLPEPPAASAHREYVGSKS